MKIVVHADGTVTGAPLRYVAGKTPEIALSERYTVPLDVAVLEAHDRDFAAYVLTTHKIPTI